jgi:hypothetical protein
MVRFSTALVTLLALVLPLSLQAKAITAMQAVEIAKRQVPTESQGKLIAIRGDRSESELTPDTWHIVFYDEMASQNGRQITVTDHAVAGIREGYFDLGNLRIAAYKMEEVISPEKFKIDSDKALNILVATNRLQFYSLSSVLYSLERDSDLREAIWKLEIYVDDGTGKEKRIGYARISAENGRLVEMRFKPFVPKTDSDDKKK